jgi:hypothetical protein
MKQTQNEMNAAETLRKEIEAAAKEINVSEIEIISQMQGLLVEKGDEKSIIQLHNLKMEYAKKQGII